MALRPDPGRHRLRESRGGGEHRHGSPVPGDDDFYSFDGSRPVSIGLPGAAVVFSRLDKSLRYKIAGMYDKANGLVWWFYPSTASGGAL